MQQDRKAQLRNDHAETLRNPLQSLRPPDMERLLPPGFFEAQQEPGKAGAVIPVKMSHRQPFQAFKPPAQTADPHLGSLAAVQQKSLSVHPEIQGRQRPVRQRQRPARAQRAAFQHPSSLPSVSYNCIILPAGKPPAASGFSARFFRAVPRFSVSSFCIIIQFYASLYAYIHFLYFIGFFKFFLVFLYFTS